MFYYNGQHVTNVRFYEYNGKSKVSFMIGAQTYYADAENLQKAPTPESVSQDVFVEDEPKQEELVEVVEEELEPEVEPEPEVELAVEMEPEVDEPADEAEALVAIIDLDGDEDEEIVDLGSQDFQELVKKHGWDIDAIERVLNGEQKTHKGYSFKWA